MAYDAIFLLLFPVKDELKSQLKKWSNSYINTRINPKQDLDIDWWYLQWWIKGIETKYSDYVLVLVENPFHKWKKNENWIKTIHDKVLVNWVNKWGVKWNF